MKKHKLDKFELVVVNLYPFEKVIEQTKNIKKCIENIDVGGPINDKRQQQKISTQQQ